jgi:hypothetical protein
VSLPSVLLPKSALSAQVCVGQICFDLQIPPFSPQEGIPPGSSTLSIPSQPTAPSWCVDPQGNPTNSTKLLETITAGLASGEYYNNGIDGPPVCEPGYVLDTIRRVQLSSCGAIVYGCKCKAGIVYDNDLGNGIPPLYDSDPNFNPTSCLEAIIIPRPPPPCPCEVNKVVV